MKRTCTHLTASLAALLMSATSLAIQDGVGPVGAAPDGGAPIPADPDTCVFRQPWTPPAASFSSRVFSCQQPVPLNLVALDDFECDLTGNAGRLRWWGVLLDPQQAQNRPYYVAIYSDNGNCQPDMLLYEACVVPQVEQHAMDCTGRNVFVFRAQIPPFAVTAGERYWLQISEDDQNSANQGLEDFRWSGRQPPRLCDAVQMDAAGVAQGPLIDACNQMIDDLSFAIVIREQP